MKVSVLSVFLLLFTLGYHPAYSQKNTVDQSNDSVTNYSKKTNGAEGISSKLQVALKIVSRDKNKALEIVQLALHEAKDIKHKELESKAYHTLGRIYEALEQKDVAGACYDSSLVIARKNGDYWNIAEALYRKGVLEYSNSKEAKALEDLNESVQSGRLSKNFKTMGSAYSMMGTIFRVNGFYDRAIEYTVNAKLNYEKAGFTEGNAWSTYILGRIYADLKLPDKAIEYFQESLNMYSKIATIDGNKEGIAICFEQIGLLKLESGKFAEARQCIDSTLTIYTEKGSKYGTSNAYKNLGLIEYANGDYDLSQKYLEGALKTKKEISDLLSFPTIYEYIGLCLVGKGQTVQGIEYLKQGLAFSVSNNQKKLQLNIYAKLTEVYLKINDLSKAIECQKKQIEIQDLILSGAANIKFEQLQAIYEIDKKNAQIVELEKQNEFNALIIKQHRISNLIMVGGIIIAILIAISVYLFYNKIKHKNQELKESNAAKDKLFAIIAHDLRGPTWNLATFLEHLNETFSDHSPDELRKILISLHKSADDVSVLLENLLIWARSQLNKIEYVPHELILSTVIRDSVKGLKQTAESKEQKIVLELDDQLAVFADSNMIQTIVRNLLSNALKFTRRGGRVVIKTEKSGSNVARISIADNGIGIEKPALSQIFEVSNSFQRPGTENEKSTGLGLILVKDFVEKNNGTISIESEVGKGTVVIFTLPVA